MLLLQNARIFDGRETITANTDAWLLIDGSRIADVGMAGQPIPDVADATIIDLNGQTLLPGLIDLHVHFHLDSSRNPRRRASTESESLLNLRAVGYGAQFLRRGVTSVVDLGAKGDGILALQQAVNEGLFPGPRIQSCRRPLCMTGGHFVFGGSREVDGVPQMLTAARDELDKGADLLKFMASAGIHSRPGEPIGRAELTVDELRAGVEVAHARGKRASAHAISNQSIKNAVRAGMNTVEHAPFLDEEAIELMLTYNTTLIPTAIAYCQIMMLASETTPMTQAGKIGTAVHEAHMESIGQAYRAGVAIAVGTDAGSPNNPHGDVAGELELFARAGLDNMDILKATTSVNAQTMGWGDELGALEVGKLADVIVVDGNPADDLASIRNVRLVIKGGEIVHQI